MKVNTCRIQNPIRTFIHFVLLTGFLLLPGISEGKGVPGFIITEKSDTLHGEILFLNYNPFTGGVTFHGVDLEYLHYEVSFKENGKRWYKNFQPGDIQGFGFYFNSMDYIFHSFVLKKNSLVRNECFLPRFLNLVYRKGPVSVFRNRTRLFNSEPVLPTSIVLSDYYLLNDRNELTKIESKEELNNLLNQRH